MPTRIRSTEPATRIRRAALNAALNAATALVLCCSAVAVAPAPAQAQQVVFDPSNHVQAVLQAQRALQSVNNQLRQLENEVKMLSALDMQMAPELNRSIASARGLFEQASAVRYNLGAIAREVKALYPDDFREMRLDAVLTQSDAWMAESRASLESLMTQQARAADGLGATQAHVNRALEASGGAEGQTSAIQATNQMLGVLSAQLADLQALQIAQSRALASQRLEQEARAARAAEIRRQAFPAARPAPVDPARSAF